MWPWINARAREAVSFSVSFVSHSFGLIVTMTYLPLLCSANTHSGHVTSLANTRPHPDSESSVIPCNNPRLCGVEREWAQSGVTSETPQYFTFALLFLYLQSSVGVSCLSFIMFDIKRSALSTDFIPQIIGVAFNFPSSIQAVVALARGLDYGPLIEPITC